MAQLCDTIFSFKKFYKLHTTTLEILFMVLLTTDIYTSYDN